MSTDDPYEMLQSPPQTPEDELCQCAGDRPIKLMQHWAGFNPVHCLDCNLEVPPERLPLDREQVNDIAYWARGFAAIDWLWTASGAYELWAREQLSDIGSSVNALGRRVARQLDGLRRCYYWYFQDESAEDYAPISRCPSCGVEMAEYTGGIFLQRICEDCRIVTSGE